MLAEAVPRLSDDVRPPEVAGVAALATLAFAGADLAALLEHIPSGNNYDRAVAHLLAFRRGEGLALQDAALAASALYRVRGHPAPRLRLLAVMAPGDFMVNAPLDFLLAEQPIRLDLLYVLPDAPLPPQIPDHDVAFFAVSEADPPLHARLQALFDAWPRPALNDPAHLPALARDALHLVMTGVPGLCSPPSCIVPRAVLLAHGVVAERFPLLLRPAGSHAGHGLEYVANGAALGEYLRLSAADPLCLTAFADYLSNDGLFRKYRIAFVGGTPFLCHMAVSAHWMVRYLNAGMVESAERRAEEAAAMAGFDAGFARRHAAALGMIATRLPFDLFSIDCAELPDGRLLLFEADTAAILHLMDPPELFAYKQAPMRRVFSAFAALLAARAQDRRCR